MALSDRSRTRRARIKAIPVLLAAAVGALAFAPSALAGTISLNRRCYVSRAIGAGTTIEVKGVGFTPGEAVFAQIPAPDGLLSYVEATVGPEGDFVATLTHVLPVSIDPIAEKEKMQIKGVLSEAILAEAPFSLTNLAVKLQPSSARPNQKVTYRFAGFRRGKPIYGHYLHKGKVVITHKFGKARGACGTLKTKSKIFPGNGRFSQYKVQFDQSKRYKKHASPKIDTGVTIFRF